MAPEGKRRWQGGDSGPGGGSASANYKRPSWGGAAAASGGSAAGSAPAPARSAYTPMFERFRGHLDAHHDRRERVVKASRDITALSKKIIFALQRVRRIHPALPADVDREVTARLAEISRLLASIAPEMQDINRGRYGRVLFGMEELMEALTFLHYLRHQALLSLEEASQQVAQMCRDGRRAAEAAKRQGEAADSGREVESAASDDDDAPAVVPDENDFLMGVFDLSGEMMRFATTSAALRGELASDDSGSRTIVGDMQELSSFFQMLPQRYDKSWKIKMQVMQTSVQKVERLGYDLRVRGSERPKGWVPDTADNDEQPGSPR